MKSRHAWVLAWLGCWLAPAPAQDAGAASDPLRAVLEAAVEPSVGEGLVVEVVNDAGKPVPGAIVGCATAQFSQPDDAHRRAFEALVPRGIAHDEDRRTAAFLLVFATRYRTDAEGRAILPPDAKRPLMACGNGVAVTEPANSAAGPVRLVLRQPASVRVRAVDPDGKPVAGVLLRLGRDDDRSPDAQAVFTDRRGEAVVRVPRALRDVPQRLRLVASLGDGPDDPRIQFASGAVPTELQVLPLPPTGLVRVIVYGDDEKPLTNVGGVVLVPENSSSSVDAMREGRHGLAPTLGGPLEPSGTTIRVALGKSFTVRASLSGVSGDLHGTCKGPTQPNELIVCDLRATQGPPVVSFVVRGIDGEPLRDTELGYVKFCASRSDGRELRSDGDGRVRVVLPEARPDDLELLVVRRVRIPGPQPLTRSEGAGRVLLPRELKAGENALPDVRLAEEPVYVAGQVVDDDGKPVAKAVVEGQPVWERGASGLGGGPWFFRHRVLTDEAGRFELRDGSPAASMLVRARAQERGWEAANAQCTAGAQALKLVVRRTGSVTIALEGLPQTPHPLLEGSVVPAGGGPEVRRFSVHDAETTLHLPAGRYDVVLCLDKQAGAVLRVADFEVPGGAACTDQRLQHLAWRDHLSLVTLTVVDRDNKPVPDRKITHWVPQPDGGYGGGGGFTDQDGRFTLLVPKAGGHLAFAGGSGLRSAGLERVTADQTVVLQPELAVAIELRGDCAVPEGIKTEFRLLRSHGQDPVLPPDRDLLRSVLHRGGMPVFRVRKGGILETALSEAGSFDMGLVVHEPLAPGRSRMHMFRWGSIDVKDQVEPQSFVLEMSDTERDKFAALVERLKQ